MLKAIIFDMDGTMFNTEILWGDVTRRLAESYGTPFDPAVRVQMMGKKDHEALAIFREFFHIDASVDELVEKRRALVLADTGVVRVNPGLIVLLDLLDRLHMKKAVATSSFKAFTDKLLAQFEMRDRFDFVITGDEIAVSKPDPGLFLAAAAALGVEPEQCLVLEDAQNGVEAAYNARMKVFAIPHDHSRHHDFSKADRIINSMAEIDEATLASL